MIDTIVVVDGLARSGSEASAFRVARRVSVGVSTQSNNAGQPKDTEVIIEPQIRYQHCFTVHEVFPPININAILALLNICLCLSTSAFKDGK